jgi:hypothetical protein
MEPGQLLAILKELGTVRALLQHVIPVILFLIIRALQIQKAAPFPMELAPRAFLQQAVHTTPAKSYPVTQDILPTKISVCLSPTASL